MPIAQGVKRPPITTTHPELVGLFVDPEVARTHTARSGHRADFACPNCGRTWNARIGRVIGDGSRCPYCAGRRTAPGVTDAATTHPHASRYFADPEVARLYTAGSKKVADFACPDCAHTWQARILDTVGKGRGCPRCARTAELPPISATHPALVPWFVQKVHADTHTAQSRAHVPFQHPDCQHIFTARVNTIVTGGFCPVCLWDSEPIVGENDAATTHPDRAHLFADPADAHRYRGGSGKRALFRCPDGHTWTAVVATVIAQRFGCPTCAGRYTDPIAVTHPHIAALLPAELRNRTAGSTLTVQLACQSQHDYTTTIGDLVQGARCPTCHPPATGYRDDREGFFYILTGQIDGHAAMKYGITNTPADRITAHAAVGLDHLAHIITGPGNLIRELETDTKRTTRERGIITLDALGYTFPQGGPTETMFLDTPAARDLLDELLRH